MIIVRQRVATLAPLPLASPHLQLAANAVQLVGPVHQLVREALDLLPRFR